MLKTPLLCVPLTQPTTGEMISVLQTPEHDFDLAEVRLDYLYEPKLEPFFATPMPPLLFTNRAPRDFGRWRGNEEERMEVLNRALDLGAEWIDIERECLPMLRRRSGCKTVISYHNFMETPINLPAIAKEIEQMEGDVVKVATMARSHQDNVRMIQVIRQIHKPVIGVTMGPHGHVVRILGPKLGAFLVFASLKTGRESAPGQVPASELLQHFRFREMTQETAVYGLVNLPAGQQWSHLLNRAFTESGVDAVALPLESENLADVLNAYRHLPFAGFSLGQEFWARAQDLADDLETGIERVDTITWRDGHWTGQDSHSSPAKGGDEKLDTASRLAAQMELWTGKTLMREWLVSGRQALEV